VVDEDGMFYHKIGHQQRCRALQSTVKVQST